MRLALELLFMLLLSGESLWLFALSAHVARFMEIAAPVFWLLSLCALWSVRFRDCTSSHRHAILHTLLTGILLMAAGAVLAGIAIASA